MHYEDEYEEYCDREYERKKAILDEKTFVMESITTEDMIKIMFSHFWDGLGCIERDNIVSGVKELKRIRSN